jgi:hypothetical protein
MKGNRRAEVSVSLVNAGGSYLLKVTPTGQSSDGKDAHSVTVLLTGAEADKFRASLDGSAPVDTAALLNALA